MRYQLLSLSFALLCFTTPAWANSKISLIADALPRQNNTANTPKALVTSRAKGIVVTPVSWISSASQQKFRVKLTEPLLAADGSIILPKDTLLLAEVTNNNWEFINAQITGVLIRDTDTPIPSNTLILQGEGGNPLQAVLQKPSNNAADHISRSVGSGIISGLSNTLRSSLPFGASRTFTNPVLNEGSSSIQRTINSSSSQRSFFSLKENTPVVIVVNQTFSLP